MTILTLCPLVIVVSAILLVVVTRIRKKISAARDGLDASLGLVSLLLLTLISVYLIAYPIIVAAYLISKLD